jgi:transcriptional regulator GlxA family with amidase domain
MITNHWIAPVPELSSKSESRSYPELVEHAEKVALADQYKPFHISALCRSLAVSEKTLRKAFQKTHGVPPYRYLRLLRLSEARHALLSADSKLTTVTQVATSFGFGELGRFSVEYRKAFGESPSRTLSRSCNARGIKLAKPIKHQEGFGHGVWANPVLQ